MVVNQNKRYFNQISVGLIASSSSFLEGLYSGWSTSIKTYFMSSDTKLKSGPMTTEEISWMTSLLYIGAILGALVSGLLINEIGRKWSLLVWLFPPIVGNVLFIVAESPTQLFISRFICGIIFGVSLVVPSIFIAEFVEDNLKMCIGTFSGVMLNMGTIFSKCISGYFGIYAVPIASFPLIAFFISCSLQCPDTPEYLLYRNRLDKAEKSLRFYRGLPLTQPLPESIVLEFEEMKKYACCGQVRLRDFVKSTTILAIIVSFVLTSCLNFSGVRVTTCFTGVLIEDCGIKMNLSYVDATISSLQLAGSLYSIYIAHRNGVRKSLLIYFLIGLVSLFGTGIHYYFRYSRSLDLNPLTWSFLFFLTISIVVPSTGLTNICLGVPPMILPMRIRGTVLGVFSVLSSILTTIFMHYYLYFMGEIGNFIILTGFSIWCLLGAIFTYTFIPEVRNMTYAEIVSSLNKKLPRRFRNFS